MYAQLSNTGATHVSPHWPNMTKDEPVTSAAKCSMKEIGGNKNMEFVTRKTPANFNVFFIGDVHVGTLLHNENGFKKAMAMVKKPFKGVTHNVVILMGDLFEAIDTSDHRFDIYSVDRGRIRADEQVDYLLEHLYPIRKKIVLVHEGNHEFKLKRVYNYSRHIANYLDVPFGTYSAITTFVDAKGKKRFKTFTTHGAGSINSVAGPPERIAANLATALKRKLMNMAGDCAVMAMGHTHKLITVDPISTLYITSDSNRVYDNYTGAAQNADYIHPDLRYYLNTGSFTKLYERGVSGYAERAGYTPMEQGFPVITVRKGLITGAEKVTL